MKNIAFMLLVSFFLPKSVSGSDLPMYQIFECFKSNSNEVMLLGAASLADPGYSNNHFIRISQVKSPILQKPPFDTMKFKLDDAQIPYLSLSSTYYQQHEPFAFWYNLNGSDFWIGATDHLMNDANNVPVSNVIKIRLQNKFDVVPDTELSCKYLNKFLSWQEVSELFK